MRALAACVILCLSPGCCVRLRDSNSPALRGPSCHARCAQRGSGFESQSCPFAKELDASYFRGKYYRICGVDELRVEVECDGMDHESLVKTLREQLGGKHLVMWGDSIMRQSFLGLLCLLWEEGVIAEKNTKDRIEEFDSPHEVEWRGLMTGSFPELGNGTNLTFVRRNWGQGGPYTAAILDNADIIVANIGMHYKRLTGPEGHMDLDKHPHTSTYADDVEAMLKLINTRGRPGHRVFWRESISCAAWTVPIGTPLPDGKFGCERRPNPFQRWYNLVASQQRGFENVVVLPTQDIMTQLWYMHPGRVDCCHRESSIPGLLSMDARVLAYYLAQDDSKMRGAIPERIPEGGNTTRRRTRVGGEVSMTRSCPRLADVCPPRQP